MSTNIFSTLYIFTFIVIGIIIILPIVIIAFLILHSRKTKRDQVKFYTKLAAGMEKERMETMQAEINLKKKKYQRRKCPYCHSLNALEKSTCINCGGVLSEV